MGMAGARFRGEKKGFFFLLLLRPWLGLGSFGCRCGDEWVGMCESCVDVGGDGEDDGR